MSGATGNDWVGGASVHAPARRALIDRRFVPLYAMVLAALAPLATVVAMSGIGYAHDPLDAVAMAIAALAGIGVAARWLTVQMIPELAETVALFAAFSILAPLCAAVLATTNLPLADPWLSMLDHRLFGFDREHAVALVYRSPVAVEAMRFAYDSIGLQPLLLLVAFAATGRHEAARRFLGAWALTLAMCIAVFPFVPATGTPPYDLHWLDTFERLRSGALRTLGGESLTGIITFPSFHAAAAVLLGWGFAAFGKAGWPLVALNALMFASAIVGGGHYLVDLIAGAAVALIALRLAPRLIDAALIRRVRRGSSGPAR